MALDERTHTEVMNMRYQKFLGERIWKIDFSD